MLRNIAIVSALSALPLSVLAAPNYSCKGVRIPGAYLKPGDHNAKDRVLKEAYLNIKQEGDHFLAEIREKSGSKKLTSPVVQCEDVSSADAQWFLYEFDANLAFPKIAIEKVDKGTFCEVNYGTRRHPKKAKLYYFYDKSEEVVGKLVLLNGRLGECMR